MTPERWAQIEELFHRAAECDPKLRACLLDAACKGDEELRRVVEGLLTNEESARDDIRAAVQSGVETVPFPLLGETVSHYRIVAGLRGGGMGIVYRAEDTKLGRQVALKFLPEESTRNPEALNRFEREARSASALEHPNICPIYEFGEHEGQPFLVMQLLQGRTLRELISDSDRTKPPLELPKLLDISLQIVDALEVAHRHGIIHRDIKPANIFLTTTGQVKLLDFGLAKLSHDDAGKETGLLPRDDRNGAKENTLSPTNPDAFLSRTGVAMGTAGYMSPEQARGEKVDARSDLFSFGIVLYEMATGRNAFQGETAAVLREAILTHTPRPVRQLNAKIPFALEAVINKALAKDPDARFQTAADMRAQLTGLKRKLEPKRSASGQIFYAFGFCVLIAILVAILWLAKRQPSPPLELRQRQLTGNSSENAVVSGTISPDGTSLAYTDRQGIHIKQLESGEMQTIPQPAELKGLEGDWGIVPTWAPNSTALVANLTVPGQQPGWGREISGQSSIWTVPLLGGSPQKLHDNAYAYTLSRDGNWLAFGPTQLGGHREMWVMKPDGSGAHVLFKAEENTAYMGGEWSPDGRRLAYIMSRATRDDLDIFMQTRDFNGGPPTTVFTFISEGHPHVEPSDWSWSPDGRIIYGAFDDEDPSQGCNFWAIDVDLTSGKPKGSAKRLTNWTGFCMDDIGETSDGKRLAFRKWSTQGSVYVADIQGNRTNGTRITTPRRLTLNEARNYPGAWTADSKAVVFASNVDGQWRIFKQSLDQETSEPITSKEQGAVLSASVTPDGAWILYAPWPRSGYGIYPHQLMRAPIKGGSPELVLTGSPYGDPHCARLPATLCAIAEFSAGQQQIVFTAFDPVKGRGRELYRLEIGAKADPDFLWDLSPDGNRIAILEYSGSEMQIVSFDGAPARHLTVSGRKTLQSVNWSADGKGFLVSSVTNSGSVLLLVDLQGDSRVLWEQKGSIAPWNVPLTHRLGGPSGPWAVPSPDGRHLAIHKWDVSANMWLMENF